MISKLQPYALTAGMIGVAGIALILPAPFLKLGGADPRHSSFVLVVVQVMMFGLGTQLRLADFAQLAQRPQGVMAGVVGHFLVMPLAGLSLARMFRFPPEIAAGFVLVGSAASGLVSNVMAYLAKANLALSATVTAVTMLLTPIMSPLWMRLLAGTRVEVGYLDTLADLIRMVVAPMGAALLHDYLKTASPAGWTRALTAGFCGVPLLAFLEFGGGPVVGRLPAPVATLIGSTGFLFGAVLAGLAYHALASRAPELDRHIPEASLVAMIYLTAAAAAAGRDNILHAGGWLWLAALLQNLAGLVIGYWLGRAGRLNKTSARALAFATGMPNAGMASSLAANLGKLGTIGMAAAILNPLGNLSGAALANYWRKRSVK